MKIMWCRKFLPMTVLLLAAAVMAACSGGGGSSAPPSATISGAVVFPGTGDVVAKRVGAVVSDSTVTVEVYNLEGKKVATVKETQYDDAQQTYSYSVPALPSGVDYVVKVKRGIQVLKKLVEKKSLLDATAKQNVDAATTATVMIAEQRLSTTGSKVVLGEEVAAGAAPPAATIAALSQQIEVFNPRAIQLSIETTIDAGKSALTSETAAYANIYNMVVVAVSTPLVGSIDALLTGTGGVTVAVPTFTVDAQNVVVQQQSSISSETATSLLEQATEAYVPPATNTGMAPTYVAAAKIYLNKQDIANAYKNFELAVMADSENVEANVGSAITGGIMLLDDEQVRTIVGKWDYVYPTVNQIVQEISPVGNPFNNMTSAAAVVPKAAKTAANLPVAPDSARNVLAAFNTLKAKMPQQKSGFKSLGKELGLVVTTAPTVSEMQAVIDNVIIPRLDTVLARLAKVEGKTANTFTITAQMQGNPVYGQDVVLGDGEYYTLDAAVNVFQAIFKLATAYNLDIPAGYTYNTIERDPLAMVNDPKVFTLKADGGAKMNAALAFAKAAAAKTKAAYDVVKTRAAGAGTYNIATWTQADRTSFEEGLGEVTAAMSGETTFTTDGITVKVNFTKFFTNPLTRANLPTLAYDVPRVAALSEKYGVPVAAEVSALDWSGNSVTVPIKCDIVGTSDLPDFTLNGIFPGNTAASTLELVGFSGVVPFVSAKILSGDTDKDSWNYASSGDSFYYLAYSTDGQVIKKIDLATGAVSKLAASSSAYVDRLLWYDNKLHAVASSWRSFSIAPITITQGTFTVGSPVYTSSQQSGDWAYVSGIASNGTDIYFAVETWDYMAWQGTTSVGKISDLQSETLLFSEAGMYIETLGVHGGYLYADGQKRSLASPSTVVASYLNAEGGIMVGGYFYDIENGKLLKYAGAPAGGSAKFIAGR